MRRSSRAARPILIHAKSIRHFISTFCVVCIGKSYHFSIGEFRQCECPQLVVAAKCGESGRSSSMQNQAPGYFDFNILRGLYWKIVPFLQRWIQPVISTRRSRYVRIDLAVLENSTIHAESSAGHFDFNILRRLYWKMVPFLHRRIQPVISTRRRRCVRINLVLSTCWWWPGLWLQHG